MGVPGLDEVGVKADMLRAELTAASIGTEIGSERLRRLSSGSRCVHVLGWERW